MIYYNTLYYIQFVYVIVSIALYITHYILYVNVYYI